MPNYPDWYISFSQNILQTNSDKVKLWSKGKGELAEACKKIIEAGR